MTTALTALLPTEWLVDVADCPTDSLPDALEFCLRYAVLAPSTHNAQPWQFRLDGSTVDVILDCTRGLPVTDPDDREAVISVGAAVMNLRVALARVGLSCSLQPWPDPLDPECIVRIEAAGGPGQVQTSLAPLHDAVARRHTSRSAFRPDEVAPSTVAVLHAAAEAEGAGLLVVSDYTARHLVADLVADADRRQMADTRFRRELASWLRSSARARDGIRGHPIAHSDVLTLAAPLIVRTFDLGTGRAARDREIAAFSPALALLTTAHDERADWLTAGQALERVLLRATLAGVGVGFLDQPIEVVELRERIGAAFGTDDVPQVLLRLGYGPTAAAQRRRPLEEVLVR